MPEDDLWEWNILMYVVTVLLKRSEREFWRMTPRKVKALTDAHVELNSSPEDREKAKKDKPKFAYIDQIAF